VEKSPEKRLEDALALGGGAGLPPCICNRLGTASANLHMAGYQPSTT